MTIALNRQNVELFNRVREMIVAGMAFEAIADQIGEGVNDVVGWFVAFPPQPTPALLPRGGRVPRSLALKDELDRLRDRERSLVTVCTESPRQLAVVQRRIANLTGQVIR